MEFQNRLYELLELGEYDIPTFRERMEAVKGKIAALERKEAELAHLAGCEARYQETLRRKQEALKESGSPAAGERAHPIKTVSSRA